MSARSQHSTAPAEDTKGYTLAAMPPTPFGKYVLVGKLGHGGMAEVNLAVTGGKGGFRKLFVIKRLHAHLEAEPGFVDMFLDEARLAAQLDHPHCVQTVEVGEVGGQHFLAMEYLDGQGLERLLRMAAARNEPIPPTLAARICLDALDGIGYAHELTGFDGQPLGVVHRDISPQNLFVTYSGVVKVLDFGIAKAASNVVETRTGVIKGKYAYIAPEQALANTIDARADLWSMGVVFWEMLTTRRLFKSVNELATLQETLRGDIRTPSEALAESGHRGVPPELDAIVMRALQRDPNQRYATAAAFKADLEGWLVRQPATPDRRAISTLMNERFAEVITVQKGKLRECLAAVAQMPGGLGVQSVERLIEAGGTLASAELPAHAPGVHTPSGAATLAGGPAGHGPYPTPTPYPSNPYAGAYPSNPYVAPPPTPYPSNPWVAHSSAGPVPGTNESTVRLMPPPPREKTRRSVGWWLVGVGMLAIATVLVLIWWRRGTSGDTELPPGTVAVHVIDPAPPATGVAVVAPVGPAGPATVPSSPGAPAAPVEGPELAPSGEETGASDPVRSGSGGGRRRREGAGASGSSGSSGSSGAAGSSPPPVEPTPPEPPPSEGTPSDVGYLTLATSPWTNVSCDGRSLGETPLMHVTLPVGHHSCRLVNEAEGIHESYDLDIRPGETTRVRLGLR